MGKHVTRPAAATAPAPGTGTGRVTNPLELLLPYQRKVVEDPARFIAACFGRQTGKSFTMAARCAVRLITHPGITVMIAAPSGRQSAESLTKVKEWLRAFAAAFDDELDSLRDVEDGYTAKCIKLSNGSRCVAVPGRPDTVRGFSGDIWLDEFAFFDDPDATWRAIAPTILNPLRGGSKTVMVTSTPNGRSSRGKRFWGIMSGEAKGNWSTHLVPLRKAIADGLPVDYQELADLLDDPIAQAQELDCEFIDGTQTLLPYDIIALAETPAATETAGSDLWQSAGRDLRLGIDFGRSNDPTVCWTLERVGDVLWTREVLVLRDMAAPEQEAILRSRIRASSRVCFDYTGPGIGLGDYLAREFGAYRPEQHEFGKLELCTFTAKFKRELFPRLRRAFEAPTALRIPISEAIRDDLHAMEQLVRNGEYTYAAPRTAEGHSDRCTALALAVRAASGAVTTTPARLPHERREPAGRHPRILRGARRHPSRNAFNI